MLIRRSPAHAGSEPRATKEAARVNIVMVCFCSDFIIDFYALIRCPGVRVCWPERPLFSSSSGLFEGLIWHQNHASKSIEWSIHEAFADVCLLANTDVRAVRPGASHRGQRLAFYPDLAT